MSTSGQYFVAVVGGAISGSVSAEILADHRDPRGCVRAEHQALRKDRRRFAALARRTAQTGIRPNRRAPKKTKRLLHSLPDPEFPRPGRTSSLKHLSNRWGFSAVILANGAWRDRDLGVPGADKFVGRGLVYQNRLIHWYNHKNEKGYSGPRYETPDGALVVGGGLASIDVVKVLQFENYERALKARGFETGYAGAGTRVFPRPASFTESSPRT